MSGTPARPPPEQQQQQQTAQSPVKAAAQPAAKPVRRLAAEVSGVEAVKLTELEEKLRLLEQQLEKYKTMVGLQVRWRHTARETQGIAVAYRLSQLVKSEPAGLRRFKVSIVFPAIGAGIPGAPGVL